MFNEMLKSFRECRRCIALFLDMRKHKSLQMTDRGLIVTLSDLRSARVQERSVLAELETRLEDQIFYAIHSASEADADENFVRMALPTLLLSIAARYFLDMKEQTSNPQYPGDFALLANQSIDWAFDRNSFSSSSSH